MDVFSALFFPITYLIVLSYLFFYFKETNIPAKQYKHIFISYGLLLLSIFTFSFQVIATSNFFYMLSFTLFTLANYFFLIAIYDLFKMKFDKIRWTVLTTIVVPTLLFFSAFIFQLPYLYSALVTNGTQIYVFVLIVLAILKGLKTQNQKATLSPLLLFTMVYTIICVISLISIITRAIQHIGFTSQDIDVNISVLLNLIRLILAFGYTLMLQKLIFSTQTDQYLLNMIQFDYFKTKSEIDHLSQIYNRHKIEEIADKFIKANTPFNILFIDIDHFKSINDTYGHSIGDDVIIDVSSCLKQTFRDSDAIARWGGDEFLVLLQRSDASNIDSIIKNTKESISSLQTIKDVTLTVSIGSVEFIEQASFQDMVSIADKSLYIDKESN